MRITSDNQIRTTAKQVLGGPDVTPETNTSQINRLARQSTAATITSGSSADRFAQPGLENLLTEVRKQVSGKGISFDGQA